MFGGADATTGALVEGWLPGWTTYPIIVMTTTIVWITVMYMTPPENNRVLFKFYQKIQPGGPGWSSTVAAAQQQGEDIQQSTEWSVPSGILAMVVGCFTIYGVLFSTGYWIYGRTTQAMILTVVSLLGALLLTRLWKNIRKQVL